MAQSLARLLVHLVFSTKNRECWLDEELRPQLFAYLATIGRNLDCEVFRVGGYDDHVHIAVNLCRTLAIAEFVKQVKQSSSAWLKRESPAHAGFSWQSGYGAFSIGESQLPKLIEYIDRQEEHHKRTTFQEEYLALLSRYGIGFDERYVWD